MRVERLIHYLEPCSKSPPPLPQPSPSSSSFSFSSPPLPPFSLLPFPLSPLPSLLLMLYPLQLCSSGWSCTPALPALTSRVYKAQHSLPYTRHKSGCPGVLGKRGNSPSNSTARSGCRGYSLTRSSLAFLPHGLKASLYRVESLPPLFCSHHFLFSLETQPALTTAFLKGRARGYGASAQSSSLRLCLIWVYLWVACVSGHLVRQETEERSESHGLHLRDLPKTQGPSTGCLVTCQ